MKAFIQHKDSDGQKLILQALVPFTSLKDSVLFTYRAVDNLNIRDKKAQFQSSKEFYQRRVDSKRSSEIKEFILKSILSEKNGGQLATLFPTSMILALSTDDDTSGNSIKGISEDDCTLELSSNANVFIVDGQHRMMGMINLYDELSRRSDMNNENSNYVLKYLERYKFNCTILVNFDLWEQGQVFVNVNFKQKPVNKSLYYEIFGSEYRENETDWNRNQIYISHNITLKLNEHQQSPYYQHVKMLGTGKGYVSQAFVVESLQRHFKRGGLWYFDPDSTTVSNVNTDDYAIELISFFVAIKELFKKFWPKNDEDKGTIICKTTGFGAWVRIMGMMRSDSNQALLSQLRESAAADMVCQPYIDHVKKKLDPVTKYGELLFGENSEFSSSSGLASVSKLFKKILFYLQMPQTEAKQGLPFDSNKVSEELQDYLWMTTIDDLNTLGHHYDVENISEFEIVKQEKQNDVYEVNAAFNIYVNIYLDNEDETGFNMEFPAEATFIVDKDSHLDDNSITVSVNTNKYYQ